MSYFISELQLYLSCKSYCCEMILICTNGIEQEKVAYHETESLSGHSDWLFSWPPSEWTN